MKDAEAKLGANHRGRQNDLNGVRLEQQVFKKPNTEDKEDGVQDCRSIQHRSGGTGLAETSIYGLKGIRAATLSMQRGCWIYVKSSP